MSEHKEPSDELRQPRLRSWWDRLKPAVAPTARKAMEPIMKVRAMSMDRARQAGQYTARKVMGLQRQANLPAHLVEKSARSVLERPMPRASDVAWQGGYRQVVKQQAPHMFVQVNEPEMPDIEMGG